jgi:hypothetical protein
MMQREHVDFDHAEWLKLHRADQGPWGKPDFLGVSLNAVALSLLEPYRERSGFLFPSSDPRRHGQPIHVRSETGRRIDASAQQGSPYFAARRITRAVRFHAFRDAKPTREAMDAWGHRLASYLTRLDEVVI